MKEWYIVAVYSANVNTFRKRTKVTGTGPCILFVVCIALYCTKPNPVSLNQWVNQK